MPSPAAPALRRPSRRAVAAALVGALLLPAAAEAQFGGLVRRGVEGAVGKKVNDKVEQKVADARPVELLPPRFEDPWVEITPERFDRYVRARAAVEAEAPDRTRQVEALRAQARARGDEGRRLWESSAAEREAHLAADRKWEDCAADALDAASRETESDAAAAQMQARWIQAGVNGKLPDDMPPEMLPVMKQMAEAHKRGDQATVLRLNQRLVEAMQKHTDAREAAIQRKACGARPAKPAAVARQEAITNESIAIGQRADSLLATLNAGVRAGLDARQEAMWIERFHAFLDRSSAPISRTFTRREWDLLTARRSEVAALVGRR